jgi:hypothetical protein
MAEFFSLATGATDLKDRAEQVTAYVIKNVNRPDKSAIRTTIDIILMQENEQKLTINIIGSFRRRRCSFYKGKIQIIARSK